MATNFPTSLDNFTNPSSGNTLDSPSHSLQHSDANDAIEAIEAKLGVGNSPAGSATAGYVLTAGTGGTTTWSALPASGGLIQVIPTSVAVGSGSGSVDSNGKVTFSGASSVSLNGCFSNSYESYKILISIDSGTGASGILLRMRSSGTDLTTSSYDYVYMLQRSTFISGRSTAQTSIYLFEGGNSSAQYTVGDVTIHGPFLTEYTKVFCNAYEFNDAAIDVTGGQVNVTTSYDGFTIIGSGNITGRIVIYGYKG